MVFYVINVGYLTLIVYCDFLFYFILALINCYV